MTKTFFCAFCCMIPFLTFSQQLDTTKKLREVQIRPYFSTQPMLRATGAVGLLDSSTLNTQPATSFVAAMNTIPGLRMEERSPGSYRLSIRGSLLRSPFGVRNVKIYFDDFPLTDAGGNSYLNALDVAAASNLQILKGPQSSIFGANSGGVVLISPQQSADSSSADLKLQAGAYGTFRQQLSLQQIYRNYQFNITQAYQRSDGYRDHSAMNRKYIQTLQKWDYASNSSLKALLFYSDIHYQTPGGLTAAQYLNNPRASRPAAGNIKSAIEQQAGIYSKTGYAGITHDWRISERVKHLVSVFSTYTDFKNPFILNYEKRKELSLGLRSYLQYEQRTADLNWATQIGLETMQTRSDIDNYDNNLGRPAAVQASDRLKTRTNFAFINVSADWNQWLLELSGSLNLNRYIYESIAPQAIAERSNTFDPQFMPRLALSYMFNPAFSARATASRGYSAPAAAEVRASDNIINTTLQPEYGWNYETGLRFQDPSGRISADLNAFYFHLKDAIVRRLNENDSEFFVNAGGTKQWGLESSVSLSLLQPKHSGWLRALKLNTAITLSRFKFEDYTDRGNNFSGNDLTGVPKQMIVTSGDAQLPAGFYFFLQHNYTSSIPLNDANTVYARRYHLVQAKVGMTSMRIGRFPMEIFMGADNLLDEKYSLGNDLNAAGNRYFNAAAGRNFYGGLSIHFQ
ncbi:TonB-dependent receptor [Pedobacter sp. BAL39]|uniref:TonB-dependent receptor n=1 Tax=Pedobacter sp. BAL39 TaxID=391596 RepID=UPI00068064C7|nr:TonB-dependent receptor [Pedobacter sp. BAL39]